MIDFVVVRWFNGPSVTSVNASFLVEAVPRKSDGKPKRDDKAVKIDRDLARRGKFIADSLGMTLAEYLSGLLKAPIDRDWQKALKQRQDLPPT